MEHLKNLSKLGGVIAKDAATTKHKSLIDLTNSIKTKLAPLEKAKSASAALTIVRPIIKVITDGIASEGHKSLVSRFLRPKKKKKEAAAQLPVELSELLKALSVLQLVIFSNLPQGTSKETDRSVLWVDDHPENNKKEASTMSSKHHVKVVQEVSTKNAKKFLESNPKLKDQPSSVFRIITDRYREGEGVNAGSKLISYLRKNGYSTVVCVFCGEVMDGLEIMAENEGVTVASSSALLNYFVASMLNKGTKADEEEEEAEEEEEGESSVKEKPEGEQGEEAESGDEEKPKTTKKAKAEEDLEEEKGKKKKKLKLETDSDGEQEGTTTTTTTSSSNNEDKMETEEVPVPEEQENKEDVREDDPTQTEEMYQEEKQKEKEQKQKEEEEAEKERIAQEEEEARRKKQEEEEEEQKQKEKAQKENERKEKERLEKEEEERKEEERKEEERKLALKLEEEEKARVEKEKKEAEKKAEKKRQEEERKEREREEAERKEAEKKEAQRKEEAKRKEEEKKEAERKEAEKKEAEKKKEAKRKAEEQEAERKAEAKREAERKDDAKREAEAKAKQKKKEEDEAKAKRLSGSFSSSSFLKGPVHTHWSCDKTSASIVPGSITTFYIRHNTPKAATADNPGFEVVAYPKSSKSAYLLSGFIFPVKAGVFGVRFFPVVGGEYQVSVQIGGEKVNGSPFMLSSETESNDEDEDILDMIDKSSEMDKSSDISANAADTSGDSSVSTPNKSKGTTNYTSTPINKNKPKANSILSPFSFVDNMKRTSSGGETDESFGSRKEDEEEDEVNKSNTSEYEPTLALADESDTSFETNSNYRKKDDPKTDKVLEPTQLLDDSTGGDTEEDTDGSESAIETPVKRKRDESGFRSDASTEPDTDSSDNEKSAKKKKVANNNADLATLPY